MSANTGGGYLIVGFAVSTTEAQLFRSVAITVEDKREDGRNCSHVFLSNHNIIMNLESTDT